MFKFFQMLLVLLCVVGIVFYFGKKRQRRASIIFCLIGLLVMSALFSNAIVQLIPLPTDEVVITATGEKNPRASLNEVSIKGYLVGGKEYGLSSPSEGKWFWQGDVYRWRDKNDSRQPEGTTQSITLDIPYGKDRAVQFYASIWNGIAEVTYNGDSQRYDLFPDGNEKTVEAAVPDTDNFSLYSVKLLRLFAFAVIVVALMAYPCYALDKFQFSTIKNFILRNWDKLYYIVLAMTYILLMQRNSIDGSFWGDELWQLGWQYAEEPVNSFKVLDVLLKSWFYIMPYGQENLLLLPQLFVAGTICITGIIGSEYKNKVLGVLLSSSIAFSLTIMDQCAMEIRPYAMLLFSSAIVVYAFIKKQRNLGNENISVLIFYGIALVMCMGTHYFGMLVSVMFIFFDFALIILKKASPKALIEFVVPIAYLPIWVLENIGFISSRINNYHYGAKATIQRLFDAFQWVFGYNNILIACFIFGTIIIFADSIKKYRDGLFNYKSDYASLVLAVIPLSVFWVAYVYSAFINPNNSLLFDRYFVSIMVPINFVMCLGINCIIEFVSDNCKEKTIRQISTAFIVSMLCIFNWSQISPWSHWTGYGRTNNSNYRAAAEYVMSQNDAYEKSTVFFVDNNSYINRGIAYYITHNGIRDDINHYSIWDIPDNIGECLVIYLSYNYDNYHKRNGQLNSILDNEFKLVNDDAQAHVKRYVRKSGEIIGSTSSPASRLENKKNYVFQVSNIRIEKDKWYIFRFTSPDVIKDKEDYMYLLRTNSGSAHPEHHFAMTRDENNEIFAADFDIVGEVLSGR